MQIVDQSLLLWEMNVLKATRLVGTSVWLVIAFLVAEGQPMNRLLKASHKRPAMNRLAGFSIPAPGISTQSLVLQV